MPSILKIFDNAGVEIPIPAIQGPAGPAGPNSVSTSTDSSVTGILKGAAGKVAQAIAGTDYATPASTMRLLISRTIGVGENVSAITWTQDDAGNPLKLIDAVIRIRFASNTLANGASAYVSMRINEATDNYHSSFSVTDRVFIARLRNLLTDAIIELNKIGSYYSINVNSVSYDATLSSLTAPMWQGTRFEAASINQIYLAIETLPYFPAGTIEIYGRTA